jgi:hypothetical protein
MLYCHMYESLEMGCGPVTGFIDHLQIVTTSNYNTISDSHTLQFTAAHTKASQSALFIIHCVVTVSEGRRSPYSGFPNYFLASATVYNDRIAAVL